MRKPNNKNLAFTLIKNQLWTIVLIALGILFTNLFWSKWIPFPTSTSPYADAIRIVWGYLGVFIGPALILCGIVNNFFLKALSKVLIKALARCIYKLP